MQEMLDFKLLLLIKYSVGYTETNNPAERRISQIWLRFIKGLRYQIGKVTGYGNDILGI